MAVPVKAEVLEACTATCSETGGAYWYVVAETVQGRYFVKVPFANKGGGHGSAWREYVVGSFAREVGLPALEPRAVRVTRAQLPEVCRADAYLGDGDIFCGTPVVALSRDGDYELLTSDEQALLYVFDTFIGNGDRARPGAKRCDCWRSENGVVLLDWDQSALSNQRDDQRNVIPVDWGFSNFLSLNLTADRIEAACARTTLALSDEKINTIVGQAGAVWRDLDQPLISGWLLRRRDVLLAEFAREDGSSPPWLPRA